ncbi:hypothetical protein QP343_04760 [Lactobacillus jensenii]|jgi:hypothetical protein|uniref:DUF1056 family protein n=1 Tax=Lactobacillus jensenii TaxID=109790 RepID=A0A5N1IAN1_LACJE|nr:hypothetical protein [Lactobacillus jensenii]ERJ42454.1 hypothetical protein N581_10435 [Lactobacillus jensenii MD IIE-70(2)]APT15334.1 hypothetical protein BUE77_08085 [Lactobacillus jensenii]KAA9233520.1 hypothetical protein F6I36_08175 [Lactobacillus jensenii]KAA9258142.1 hypothetical protein F6I24_06060 [Lactobacillus jensenii]KAA9263809.1 hypothetical protein F6I21_07500 [Lactobacillus jensenii]
MKRKVRYPHFLMIFVDDLIVVTFLIAYLISIFQGQANGFISLVAIIFTALMILHINRLIKEKID